MMLSLEEWSERLNRLFVREFLNQSNIVEVSKKTGLSWSLLYKISNGRPVTLDTVFAVHQALGLDPRSFFLRMLEADENPHQAFLRHELSASQILELQREPVTAPPDPFLQFLHDLSERVLNGLRPRGPLEATHRPQLLLLEEERLRNRGRAKRVLEATARRLARELDEAPVTRGQLADLAALMASWAAVRRVAGHRNDAITTLGEAWNLLPWIEEPWSTGFWYQKGSYLLRDLNKAELAHDFALRAMVAFAEGGHALEIGQSLVDRAGAQYYAGRKQEAEYLFRCGLDALPKTATVYRCAAYHGLARTLRELGDLAGAVQQLDHAASLTAPKVIQLGYIRWEQACLAVALDEHDEAIARFREAMMVLSACGQATDLIFIALDYAEALVHSDRPKDAQLLAIEIAKSTELFQGNTRLRRIAEDLRAMIALGRIKLEVVKEARSRMARAGEAPTCVVPNRS